MYTQALFIFSLIFIPISGWSSPNACDDYIARHFKKDLVPVSVRYYDRSYMGDIKFPHQSLRLKVKNTGQEDMLVRSSDDNGYRDISVRIAGKDYFGALKMPLASGQSSVVHLTIEPGTLSHCRKYDVHIDRLHKAGQWGCQVWNNDRQTIQAFKGKLHCRIGRIPPRKPRPIPFD